MRSSVPHVSDAVENFGLLRLRRRPRMLVGERNGYLTAISNRHTLNASYVDVLVRFPQRHTVRELREDLIEHASLRDAFGIVKRLSRFRRRNLFVGDGSVLLRLPYAMFPPRKRTVERSLDGLIGAMRDHVAPLERTCESCARPENVTIYLADGVPGYYCDACVSTIVSGEKQLREALRKAAPDVGRGAGIGALAAVAIGLALGPVAAIPLAKVPAFWLYIAAPVFAAVGVLVSGLSGRGFGVSTRVHVILLKLLLAAFGGVVAFTIMNAVATMTIKPAEWNLVLLISSARGGAVGGLRHAAQVLAVATLAGWACETTWELAATARIGTRTRIERVGPGGECEEMN